VDEFTMQRDCVLMHHPTWVKTTELPVVHTAPRIGSAQLE
jgi:hypothetical protein